VTSLPQVTWNNRSRVPARPGNHRQPRPSPTQGYVLESFAAGTRAGAYIGIRSDISKAGVPNPIPAAFQRTQELAALPTRDGATRHPPPSTHWSTGATPSPTPNFGTASTSTAPSDASPTRTAHWPEQRRLWLRIQRSWPWAHELAAAFARLAMLPVPTGWASIPTRQAAEPPAEQHAGTSPCPRSEQSAVALANLEFIERESCLTSSANSARPACTKSRLWTTTWSPATSPPGYWALHGPT